MPSSGTRLLRTEAPIILALTCTEAAAALRMSRTALYAAIRRGELASYHVGRSRRISLNAMQAYQAQQEAAERGDPIEDEVEQQPAPTRGRKAS